jgi:CheY-like chemotaxis protein
MPDEGSPRRRTSRRTLLAMGRVGALIILATGINGALAIALPQLPLIYCNAIALTVTVIADAFLGRIMSRPKPAEAPGIPVDADVEGLTEMLRDLQSQREDERARASTALSESTAWIDRLQSDLVAAHAEADRLRGDGEARSSALTRDLEELVQVNNALRQQVADQQASATEHLARADAQAIDLNAELAKARAAAEEEARLRRIDGENARARETRLHEQFKAESKHLEHAASTAFEDVQRTRAEKDELRVELERQGETRQKLEAQLSDFDGRLAVALEELDALRAERERAKRELGELHQRAEAGKAALRGSLENEWNVKLEKVVSDLQSDHKNELGEAIADREAIRVEARTLAARVQELQHQLKTLPPPVDEKSVRDKLDAEWGAKLQKIVNELTSDHENDIGDAIAAREVARAETRSLNIRLQEVQQQLQIARDGRLGLLQRDDELSRQLEDERQLVAELRAQLNAAPPPVDEKALRERIDAEWSEKLQSIVSHVASDHESDMGKAIEEREAARAETRNLVIKVNTLLQKIDSMTTKLRQAEEEIANLRSSALADPFEPPAAIPEPPPVPEPLEKSTEEDEIRARAEVLEFAEQAHEALRRATSPGDVPLPADERKPRVLFVHHDPALRTMSGDNLRKSGFDVLTAADGLEGLRLAKVHKPDVVIADASMPKMDGRELCQLIKSNQETASVKVILMTGVYTNEVPMDSAPREFEADELLRKPVKFEALKTALSNLLAAKV